MKKTLLSELDPAIIDNWELSVWTQLNDAQKDMLLITFEFEKDKTHIDIQDMASMINATKLPIKNRVVRDGYLSTLLQRAILPVMSRPGFML